MAIVDELYVEVRFKEKSHICIEGMDYIGKLEGDEVIISTSNPYLPENGVLVNVEKEKTDLGDFKYFLTPNSLMTRLVENTILEAYSGNKWIEISELPTSYLRVRHFLNNN